MATERLNFGKKKKTFKNLLGSHIAFIARKPYSGERCGLWASGFLFCCIQMAPNALVAVLGILTPWDPTILFHGNILRKNDNLKSLPPHIQNGATVLFEILYFYLEFLQTKSGIRMYK